MASEEGQTTTPARRQEIRDASSIESIELETLGRMTRGVVHDFRNMLMLLSAHTHMLREKVGPEHHQDIDAIRRLVACSTELTSYLLESTQRRMSRRMASISDVIEALSTFLPNLIGKDIECATYVETNLPEVDVDPVEIKQIVLNLALNARDAMPDGGKLFIRAEAADRTAFRSWSRQPYVLLSVTDTGMGMTETIRSKVFNSRFSTKATGAGIGLCIVSEIAKRIDGRLEVESEPGSGSTFKVYLPAVIARTATRSS
jgi:two-component system, cell cycle sensor histidine kinase and response regulator CckA